MARPVRLLAGQWADLPFGGIGQAAKRFGGGGIGRAAPFLVASLLFVLGSGCARLPLGGQAAADEAAAGLRLYEENVKHPVVEPLTDAEVQTVLQDNVGADAQADGIVFGVIDGTGPRVFSAGVTGGDDGRKLDGDTLFQIGSITKVFTAVLLQDMVDRGEMKLDDPVQKYLPPSATMPTRNGRQITLFDLATHTSGLPRDGGGDGGGGCSTPDELYACLSRLRLSRDPGGQYEYSNLGVGLLGHVISLRAGKPYETLVVERICTPLGMDDTRVTLTPERRSRAARGHAFPGRPPVNDGEWHGPLEGCGALCSTANDLLKFVAANAGITPSSITPLLQRTYAVHKLESGRSGRLVWMDDGDVITHGGNTDGFSSDLAFDPGKRRGVVLLANVCSSRILFFRKPLLDGQSPRLARTVTLEPALLDNYVGTYRCGDVSACVVRRDGQRLLFQFWPGRIWHVLPCARLEGSPQSATVFYNHFWELGPARFRVDTGGRATAFTMTSPTFSGTWRRVSDQLPATQPVRGDPAIYARVAGKYRHCLFGLIPVGPTLNTYVTEDAFGTHLMGYVTGGDHGELYPATPTTFVSPALPGTWITASRRLTESGKVEGLTVHLNGTDVRAKRVSDTPDIPR